MPLIIYRLCETSQVINLVFNIKMRAKYCMLTKQIQTGITMKFILMSVLMGCMGLSFAQNERWAPITETEGVSYSADTKTAKSSAFPEVWIMLINKRCERDGNDYSCTVRTKFKFDCVGNKSAMLQAIAYNHEGYSAEQMYKPSQAKIQYTDVVPDTSWETVQEYVCEHYYKPSKKK